jgi:hypothetical protein
MNGLSLISPMRFRGTADLSANEIRDRILDGRFASGAASTVGKPHITWILERFS